MVKYQFSGNIHTSHSGFIEIQKFYEWAIGMPKIIEVDLSNIKMLEANMSVLLYALIDKLKCEHEKHITVNIPENMDVLNRNGFDGAVNDEKWQLIDTRKTVIPLRKFQLEEGEKFTDYLDDDLFGHQRLVGMNRNRKEKLKGAFTEVFVNVEHANTDKVYCCGQFYTTANRLKFTVLDLGDGFLKKISEKDNAIMTDEDAIYWAIQRGNTTRIDTLGGLGLYDIHKYCKTRGHEFHIATGRAYWKYKGDENHERIKHLHNNFEGTFVTLIINTVS